MTNTKQPGIDISRQKPGTMICVQTTIHLYELTLVDPATGLITLGGDDQRCIGLTGQFLHSEYGDDVVEDWVGRSMKMHIRFKNAVLVTAAAIAGSVHGDGWEYTVF